MMPSLFRHQDFHPFYPQAGSSDNNNDIHGCRHLRLYRAVPNCYYEELSPVIRDVSLDVREDFVESNFHRAFLGLLFYLGVLFAQMLHAIE